MAVSISGTMTISRDISPTHGATAINVILGKAPEQLTVGDLNMLLHSCAYIQGGTEPKTLVSTLMTAHG